MFGGQSGTPSFDPQPGGLSDICLCVPPAAVNLGECLRICLP